MSSPYIPKIPLTPTAYVGLTAAFKVTGKSFYDIQAVYLSGSPYPNSTFYNPFSGVPRLSAVYPGFTAVKLLSSQYESNNDNTIVFTIPPPLSPGYADIIVQNPAGYGSLTRYVIKELYAGTLTQQQLRPWSSGIVIYLSGGDSSILGIDNSFLVTISGDYIVEM